MLVPRNYIVCNVRLVMNLSHPHFIFWTGRVYSFCYEFSWKFSQWQTRHNPWKDASSRKIPFFYWPFSK